MRVRALIEAATLELVDHELPAPLVRLRMEQAISRSPDLADLLEPALHDFDRMVADVARAKGLHVDAINALLGSPDAPTRR